LARLAREIRLLDQICDPTATLDAVQVVQQGPAPAWTTLDGDRVAFSMKHMPLPKSAVDIAVWLGTNAHELGHVLFTPRRESLLMRRIIDGDKLFLRGIAQLHNIAEDQREERLVLARFSPWRNYLVAALSHHLSVKSDKAWLLLTGRTWLDPEVRALARAAFVAKRGEREAKEVAQLIGAYQWLTDPGEAEADQAWDILVKLHELFDDDIPTGGCGGGVIVAGEPNTDNPEGEPFPSADEQEEMDEQAGASGEGESGKSDDGKPGDETGNGSGDANDAGDKTEQAPQGDSGTGAGKGGQPPSKPTFDPRAAKQKLREQAQDGILHDEASKADMDSIMDALGAGRGGEEPEGDRAEGGYKSATDAARQLHYEVGDALLDLKDEAEPGWVKGVSNGRLNIRRLLNPNIDVDTLFDRYDPGQLDATDMELVLLLDVSGSMSQQCFSLGEATWAIRQACDDIEARVTVLTFSSGRFRLFASPTERVDERMFVPTPWGGTDPDSALSEAFHILAESTSTNRMLVILTDGDWYGEGGDKLIANLRQAGVITVLAAYVVDYVRQAREQVIQSGRAWQPDTHGIEFYKEIDAPSDLALLFRDVAVEKMRQRLT
jgi:hypothetical protein